VAIDLLRKDAGDLVEQKLDIESSGFGVLVATTVQRSALKMSTMATAESAYGSMGECIPKNEESGGAVPQRGTAPATPPVARFGGE
jgi:hypothetical protein